MFKRILLALCLVAVTLGSFAGRGQAAGLHGGTQLGAAPQNLIPASADLYLAVNSGNGQVKALRHLLAVYRAHPGTAAALRRLLAGATGAAGAGGRTPLNPGSATSMLSGFGGHAALALWLPAGAAPKATPRVALVAELKQPALSELSSFRMMNKGLGSLTPVTIYRGAPIFRATSAQTSTLGAMNAAYVSLVSGDVAIATDLATMEQVVDAATFHAPSLATSAGFLNAVAALPSEPALMVYITPHFVKVAQQAAQSASKTLPPSARVPVTPMTLRQPLAVAVSAAADGLSIVTSALPGMPASVTPNAGAGVVGSNAVVYASLDDVAAMLMASGAVPAKALAQLQVQTGIAIGRDVLPLLSHEVVIDVNDETSALLLAASQAGGTGSQAVPTLPGSVELAMWVDSPAVALQSMRRIAAALLRLQQKQGQGQAPSGPALVPTTLPDGSVAYNITALPTISFTIRGHWLIVSTNLRADMSSAQVHLASDPGYQAALAHVSGTGSLLGVQYVNMSRLLKVADAWIAYAAAHPSTGSSSSGTSGSTQLTVADWKQVEPLIAPVQSIISVTRQVAGGQQLAMFITIR